MKTTKYIVIVGEFDAYLDCMDWQEYEYDTRAEQLIAADRLQTKNNRVKLSERITESDRPTRITLWFGLIAINIISLITAFNYNHIAPMARIGETAINAGLCEQMDDGYKCLTIDGGMIFGQLN